MKRSMYTFLSLCLAVVTPHGTSVRAEVKQPAPPVELTVKSAEQKARTMLKELVDGEEQYLKRCGTPDSFRRIAEGMVAAAEKFEQAADLINGYDGKASRVRGLFEKHVAPQKTIQQRLKNAFDELQAQLVEDTVKLCMHHKVPLKAIEQVKLWSLKPGAFSDSYRPLILYGAKVAQSDWFRTGASFVASSAATGVAKSLAREAGLWNHEEGGLMDVLLTTVVETAAHAVAEEVSNPTPKITASLQKGFGQVTQSLLYGKNGFQDTCSRVMQYHLDVRQKLISEMKGGGK
ncbi:MAG: hypothetical protein ABJZ55_16530 [Fuerstiella sp.]